MEYLPVEIKSEAEVKDLLSKKNSRLLDLLHAQWKELFVINHLGEIENRSEVEHLQSFKDFCRSKTGKHKYIYYPWQNTVIKTVGEEDFFSLKTNRNRDLITSEEQHKLSAFTVAVLGLSVGSNIAFLLTQAGMSNKIFLADPDTLDTSNLNRLLTGVLDLGLNKAIISARKISEGNPYAEPVPLEDGIDDEKLESLLKTGAIHCIVEEVDALPIKISSRKLAMKYKVPVVMITDNGFSIAIHVERYDLGHKLIFEKDLAYWDEKLKGGLDHAKVSQIIIEDIFGSMEKIDKKLFASNVRIMKKELVSWPQLGSTAMFGGAAATQMIRKIALKESEELYVKKFIDLQL
jgi:molybdopterin/thiamine biosynthesis adenylyltransferase